MATKLIFMLLDKGVIISTGKPNYNSASTSAYYMNKKIVSIINRNSKYSYEKLGIANNHGKEDQENYKDVIDKTDNYHYKFYKKQHTCLNK